VLWTGYSAVGGEASFVLTAFLRAGLFVPVPPVFAASDVDEAGELSSVAGDAAVGLDSSAGVEGSGKRGDAAAECEAVARGGAGDGDGAGVGGAATGMAEGGGAGGVA